MDRVIRAGTLACCAIALLFVPTSLSAFESSAAARIFLLDAKRTSGAAETIEKLDAEFSCRLARFVREAEESGYALVVSSGYRSEEDQQELARRGSAFVCGSQSGAYSQCPHVSGRAADLIFDGGNVFHTDSARSVSLCQNNPACIWAHQNAVRFGLIFPFMPGSSRLAEPWHVEINTRVPVLFGVSACVDAPEHVSTTTAPREEAVRPLPTTISAPAPSERDALIEKLRAQLLALLAQLESLLRQSSL